MITIFDAQSRERIKRSVLWTEQESRTSPTFGRANQFVPFTPMVAVATEDIEHDAYGNVALAVANDFNATLTEGTVVEAYNGGTKVWDGSRCIVQIHGLGTTTGGLQRYNIVEAFAATRIRGTAAANITEGNTGTVNSVVEIDGTFDPSSATVLNPTGSGITITSGDMVWAELRWTGTASQWEAYC